MKSSREAMDAATLASLSRIRRQLRVLNGAYEKAEDKLQVRMRLAANLDQLRMVHSLLPEPLREKSWVLSMECYDGWTPAA
jgi:uncharacterized protein (DUF1778 family)